MNFSGKTLTRPICFGGVTAITFSIVVLPRLFIPFDELWMDIPAKSQFGLSLWRLIAAIFLLMGMHGWGSFSWNRLTGGRENSYLVLSLALGASIFSLWGFACGALGFYNTLGSVITFILLIAGIILSCKFGSTRCVNNAGENDFVSGPLDWFDALRQRIRQMTLTEGAALAIFIFLAAQRGVEAFTPPYSWDAMTYHLAVPKQYLAHGGFHLIPLNIYSNMPMNFNMLYLTAMWLGDPVVAKLLHFAFGVAAALGLVRAAKRLHVPEAGWIAAGFLFASPSVFYQWGTAFIDVGMAFFTVALINIVIDWLEEPRAYFIVAMGVLSGFLMGCKYTGVFVPVALILAIATVGSRTGRQALFRPRVFSLGVICALIWTAPWLIKSALLTGNPVYPLFFNSLGGEWWTTRMAQWLMDWQQGIGMGRSISDFALLPWRVAFSAGGDYGHFAGKLLWIPFVLSPVIVFFWGNVRLRVIWIWFWIAFFLWGLGSQQIRFLIPTLPLLCLSSAVALVYLGIAIQRLMDGRKKPHGGTKFAWIKETASWAGKRERRRLDIALFFLFIPSVALMIHSAGQPAAGPLDPAGGLQYITGHMNARDYLRPRVRSFEAFEWLEMQKAMGRLPGNSRVVMMFENMGLYCPIPWLADGMFEASYLVNLALEAGSVDKFARLLDENLSPQLIIVNYNILRDIELGEQTPEFLRAVNIQKQFLDQYCDPVFTSPMNTVVYQVRSTSILSEYKIPRSMLPKF